jgi:hypothetical protein
MTRWSRVFRHAFRGHHNPEHRSGLLVIIRSGAPHVKTFRIREWGGARSNASRKSSSETYSRINFISSCRAYVIAYTMNRTGSASSRGRSGRLLMGAGTAHASLAITSLHTPAASCMLAKRGIALAGAAELRFERLYLIESSAWGTVV